MTEQSSVPQDGIDGSNEPGFRIQRIYLKDLSLEQPNAPQILMVASEPQIQVEIDIAVTPLSEGIFEVALSSTITAKVETKVLFLIEAKQAGIFEVRNIDAEQLGSVLGIACPQIVYPYLRGNVADVIQRAGFPPVHLAEINFQAMYQQQVEAASQAAPQTIA